MIIVEK